MSGKQIIHVSQGREKAQPLDLPTPEASAVPLQIIRWDREGQISATTHESLILPR